jgi:hypothetical protein
VKELGTTGLIRARLMAYSVCNFLQVMLRLVVYE